MKGCQLVRLSLPCRKMLLLADPRLLALTLPVELGELLLTMSDDRRFPHSASHQHLPVLFAGDVAWKPGRLMYPYPVLKAACLSGRHRQGMWY